MAVILEKIFSKSIQVNGNTKPLRNLFNIVHFVLKTNNGSMKLQIGFLTGQEIELRRKLKLFTQRKYTLRTKKDFTRHSRFV